MLLFYNGTAEQPERKEMKLSDAYITPVEEPALELRVLQLNIGMGYNQDIMSKCPLLAQYSDYVARIHKYVAEMSPEEAVTYAVEECIREDILADFLQQNRAEAIEVSIFEYDEEKELALLRAAEREAGYESGISEGLSQGLSQGLRALIHTLKALGYSDDIVYSKIIENPDYAMLTYEAFEKYLLFDETD